MKNIIIYHGSSVVVKKPIYGNGNIHNDYGLGFYCTENMELGKEWASSNPSINGYLNKYELDLKNLNVLYLNEVSSTLNWITLLIANRVFNTKSDISKIAKEYLLNNHLLDISNYDVIIGYRADDSYFNFAKGFLNNTISLETLSKVLKYGDLGTQIVLMSKKAFNQIKYISYEEVDSSIYYPLRMKRNIIANNKYEAVKSSQDAINETYIVDIIRGNK